VNRYLQRLVTRGPGDRGAAGVTPLVRSRSPIAEQDQRVGIPGFEGIGFGASAPAGGGVEETLGEAQDHGPEIASPITGVRKTGDGRAQRKTAGPMGASHPSSSRPAGPPVSRDGGPSGRTPTRLDVSEQPPAPGMRLEGEGTLRHDQAAGTRPRGPARAGTDEIAPNGDAPGHPGASEQAAFADPGRTDGSAARRSGSAEVEPPLLEPRPLALTPSQQRESLSNDAAEPARAPEQGPRVVIGRINVEVIQPAAEPKASAGPHRGPLTAASVSVIGPLNRGTRTNLRLGLRHR
jgi:hypothetical protein